MNRKIAIWLFLCAFLVLCMVFIGGLTRLTESGLSIVEWKPVSGVLPPLSETAWQVEFEKYQAFPEYQQRNFGMSLAEFKGIFWLEYLHRLLGRLIGFVFLLPLIWFAYQKQINKTGALRLIAIFALGGLQGLIGWIMVKSGLVDRPDVSQIKLALHFGVALAILALLLREAMRYLDSGANDGNGQNTDDGILQMSRFAPRASGAERSVCHIREYGEAKRSKQGATSVKSLARITLAALFIQCIFGALVAGTNAGLSYSTFPLMDGRLIPDNLMAMEPWYINFVDNVTTIQFQHRIGAYVCTVLIFALWLRLRKTGIAPSAHIILALLILQISLGIATLLMHVPIALASAHQVVAALLFGCVTLLDFIITKKPVLS